MPISTTSIWQSWINKILLHTTGNYVQSPKMNQDKKLDCSHEIKRCLLLGRKAMTNLDSILKSRVITLPTKSIESKLWFFPVVMYECESWTIKKAALENWCFWTVVLEKTLESSLDSKEIKPINPKGNQSWIFRCWSWHSNNLAT